MVSEYSCLCPGMFSTLAGGSKGWGLESPDLARDTGQNIHIETTYSKSTQLGLPHNLVAVSLGKYPKRQPRYLLWPTLGHHAVSLPLNSVCRDSRKSHPGSRRETDFSTSQGAVRFQKCMWDQKYCRSYFWKIQCATPSKGECIVNSPQEITFPFHQKQV